MDKDNKQYVRMVIDEEGFDYAFRHYSSFPNIDDKKFHELREAYIKAAKELEDCVES